jgi:phenylacetate-CoA ligase
VTATCNYALSEVMGPGIAGECLERDGLHTAEDQFLVEIVDPLTLERIRPGARGELVLTTLAKEAFPLVRYRTRELTSLVPEPCPCGRTSVRLRPVEVRTDDLLVVKGVNVYPSQVEAVLRSVQGTEPNFEIVVERPRDLDEATVLVEVSESVFFDEMRRQTEFRERLKKRLASELGVTFEVKLVEKKTLERIEGKGPGNVRDLRAR